jgi:hypothetical protein
MSLRTFHIVFVLVSALLTLCVGIWSLVQYRSEHTNAMLIMAGACLACMGGLLIYGRWFLRKLKDAPL